MQYMTLNEQITKTISVLEENQQLMDMLDYISHIKLPNYYIAAGCVFQTIWNSLDGKNPNYGIKDIDVIYYNNTDLNRETDSKYQKIISDYCKKQKYDYEIDVANEARMHIWKKEKFGIDIAPYLSSEDAINKWVATTHAIGVTKENDEIKIYAPYGLNDIFNKIIRPIKHEYNTKEMYDKKAQSWNKRFNGLKIIEW